MKNVFLFCAFLIIVIAGCRTKVKTPEVLSPSEWSFIDETNYEYGDYYLKEGDYLVNEDWEVVTGKEYLTNYRYYKHSKAIYQKGEQHVFITQRDSTKSQRVRSKQDQVDAFFNQIGMQAPSFELTDRSGNKYNNENLEGKVVVFNFWFVNCPPCREEIPELSELAQAYKNDDDVVFLAPSLDDWEAIDKLTSKTPFDYVVFDEHIELRSNFKVPAYPSHVIIDKKGVIRLATVGGQHKGIFKKVLTEIIENLR